MSIGLFITYRNMHKEDRLVPIASDYIFTKHWKPICAELNLRWVPRFQHGWMLAPQDMPHILGELTQLRRYLTCGETHAEISHHMLARISVSMRELNEVNMYMDADAFVGSPFQTQRRNASFHHSEVPRLLERPVRSSVVRQNPLLPLSPMLTQHSISQSLRSALNPLAPADRPVDPLPGTAAGATPPHAKSSWNRFRTLFQGTFWHPSPSIPSAWRTTLDDF